ncbi:hypothetical protein PI125_g8142 [Phytophthora idaei]|nr:hypothetical protein PI125_g8142 [Phytophthora idaei]
MRVDAVEIADRSVATPLHEQCREFVGLNVDENHDWGAVAPLQPDCRQVVGLGVTESRDRGVVVALQEKCRQVVGHDVVENHDRGVVMPLRDDCQPAVGLTNGKRCGDGDVKLLSMYSHGLEARQRSLQRSASQLNLADRMRVYLEAQHRRYALPLKTR